MSLGFLLRPLLPTWRFFEDVGPIVTLAYRSGHTLESLGEWIGYREKYVGRHLGSLFLNSEGNLRLAEQAVIERLLLESKNAETVSYQLVKNLVQSQVPNGFHFQLRIMLGGDEVLVSRIHGPFDRTVK